MVTINHHNTMIKKKIFPISEKVLIQKFFNHLVLIYYIPNRNLLYS